VTYSIVARDLETGRMGVAVQSHYFSVGGVCWGEAGVGAVATQAMANPDYGPMGVALMREGRTAAEALAALLAQDDGRELRQVAMIDARGGVAVHTGKLCIEAAGHTIGDNFAVQANMMADGSIWPAMERAYTAASGDLADRILAALDAAQAAGGDIRGQQSAAMLVVGGERSDKPWRHAAELRVEDHDRPLDELRRLLRLSRAYRNADAGDDAAGAGEIEKARARYARALELAPENAELQFWAGITLFRQGEVEQAADILRGAFALSPPLLALVPRLVPLGLVKVEDVDRIAALRPT
jgi:uncharacterized Ntn-hydrolase superfamily protein